MFIEVMQLHFVHRVFSQIREDRFAPRQIKPDALEQVNHELVVVSLRLARDVSQVELVEFLGQVAEGASAQQIERGRIFQLRLAPFFCHVQRLHKNFEFFLVLVWIGHADNLFDGVVLDARCFQGGFKARAWLLEPPLGVALFCVSLLAHKHLLAALVG